MIPEISLPTRPWVLTQLVIAVSAVGEVVRRQRRVGLGTIRTAVSDARDGVSRRARAAAARVEQTRTPGDAPALDGDVPGTVAPDPPDGSIKDETDDGIDVIEDSDESEQDSDDREFVDLADEIERETDEFVAVDPGPSDASEFHAEPESAERFAEIVIRDGDVFEVVSDEGDRVCLEPRSADELPEPVLDDLRWAGGDEVIRIERATLD